MVILSALFLLLGNSLIAKVNPHSQNDLICSKIEKVDLANQCSQDFNFSTHSRVEALAKVGGEWAVA